MTKSTKAVLHLELNPETGAFRCELPNNFIVALGAIRDALDDLASGRYGLVGGNLDPDPVHEKVIVHLDFNPLVRPFGCSPVQLTGSVTTAKGMLDYAREMVMEKLVRPSFQSKIELATPTRWGKATEGN